MSQDRLDQPLSETDVALLGDNEDIGEVGKGRLVGDEARKANLRAVAIETERHRVSNRAMHCFERDVACPMRALGEKIMDPFDIETGGIGIDLIAPAADHAAGNYGLGHRDNP
jgi:hypothetical protein